MKLLKYVMKRYIFYYERVIVWIVKILFCYELKYNSNLFLWCVLCLFFYFFKKDIDKERNIILNLVVKG